jgi:hypothetical protein
MTSHGSLRREERRRRRRGKERETRVGGDAQIDDGGGVGQAMKVSDEKVVLYIID